MARIRTIKPEFFTSRRIARLTFSARLTFIGLWTFVDDDGRGFDDARLVKAAVWPLEDRQSIARIETDLVDLAHAGVIMRYRSSDGMGYLQITNWEEHQRIDRRRKSALPAPDGWTARRGLDDSAASAPGSVADSAANDRRGLGDTALREGKGREQGTPSSSDSDSPPGSPEAVDEDDDVIDQAYRLIEDQRLAGRQLHTNPRHYREQVRADIRRTHAVRAITLVNDNPALSAAELARELEPPPAPSAPPTRDPLEQTGAAHRRKQQENEARLEAERAAYEENEQRKARADELLDAMTPEARAALEERVRAEKFTRAPSKIALQAAMRDAVLTNEQEGART